MRTCSQKLYVHWDGTDFTSAPLPLGQRFGLRFSQERRGSTLARCAPGETRLCVFRERQVLYEQGLTIGSGPNSEVIVHLPAAATLR